MKKPSAHKRPYGQGRDYWFPPVRLNKKEYELVKALQKQLGLSNRDFILRGINLAESEV